MSFRLRINKKNFAKTLESTLSTKKVRDLAYNKAVENVNAVKQEMLEKFDEHPITEELKAGANAANTSGTITGDGNLYSFIGFSSEPITVLRQYLASRGRVYKNSKQVKGINRINFVFRVDSPKLSVIHDITPLPYEKGISWVRGIEKGISNIGNYIFRKTKIGRSEMGIQAEYEVRPNAVFTPPSAGYMTEIINYFTNRLKETK